MRKRLQRLIQRATAWLYAATHRQPPPTFVRVAYCSPRRVVLITVRSDGREDVWPIDWHTPLSVEPQRYGISIYRHGYGACLLRTARCFVVNFVPAEWEQAVLACGNASGRDVDKFAATGLARAEAEVVDAPRLAGALGFLECEVERIDELGDRLFVVGRVRHSALEAPGPQMFHISSDVAGGTGGDQVARG
jgi:flavin reductase (DIM6/NTAB) family NADH-FMN oxidoreductase RutF